MATDMKVWRQVVIDEVESVSDEAFQRDVWFGGSEKWVDSPDEQFCRFFDDASIPEFLNHPDHGLNQWQRAALVRLSDLMRRLSDDMRGFINPADLIDDPRWIEIRKQAAVTLKGLRATIGPSPS